jgi:ATP-dependent helicase Lhr and Lhr-like helicase
MSTFDLLHPALQHHIVNSLNWRYLRPLQEKSIEAIHSGKHLIMLAPTAGGKTEAALFPLFSRMLFENWTGLSLIYICPIKALLNNLDDRISRYATLLGRRSAVWHGDTPQRIRKNILNDPPDCLLTTPESIEAMLISTRTDHTVFFENLQAVVVDEIHALAGDDRGWHLLSVLERLTKISGHEIQRVGLSATIGNPEVMLEWLSGHCQGERSVLLPSPEKSSDVEIKLDYVGSLANAAVVISRLHRGEKRLVFCDSRSKVEQLAVALRKQGIKTYVVHSSLSAEERKRSEEAFNFEKDCVIAATSALELGIDIGDLDRVIQIDAPATVSSFLQRLGRTGRRKGSRKNCLFLATSDQALLLSAGLIQLWSDGYVEPVIPPPMPYHVFVQQILGLLLQERGLGINSWQDWIGRLPIFKEIPQDKLMQIFNHMLTQGILSKDQGIIWFGPLGEKLYGFKNFMEICSTFVSQPLFEVKSGKNSIGYVDEVTFSNYSEKQTILLAGRGWKVKHIHWEKKCVTVEPTKLDGRSQWLGEGPMWSMELCATIKQIIVDSEVVEWWSNRTQQKINEIRLDFEWVEPNSTSLTRDGKREIWWTFAGKLANINMVLVLNHEFGLKAFADNLSIRLENPLTNDDFNKISQLGGEPNLDNLDLSVFKNEYKFHECLPDIILYSIKTERFIFSKFVKHILKQEIRRICHNR